LDHPDARLVDTILARAPARSSPRRIARSSQQVRVPLGRAGRVAGWGTNLPQAADVRVQCGGDATPPPTRRWCRLVDGGEQRAASRL